MCSRAPWSGQWSLLPGSPVSGTCVGNFEKKLMVRACFHASETGKLQQAVHRILLPPPRAEEMAASAQKINDTETIRLLPWKTNFIKVANDSNYDLVLTFIDENRLVERRRETTTTVGAKASASAGLASLATSNAGIKLSYEEVAG